MPTATNAMLNPTPHDWPEDWADSSEDNGCYLHTCASCKTQFHGHKRRPNICRICAKSRDAEVERRAAMLAQIGLDRKDWVLIPTSEWMNALGLIAKLSREVCDDRGLRRKLAKALKSAHIQCENNQSYWDYRNNHRDASVVLLAQSSALDKSLENRKKEA